MRKSRFMGVLIGLLVSAPLLANSSVPLEVKGPFTQGALHLGKTVAGAEVTLNGEAVEVTDNGYFVFGFGRKAELEHELSVSANGETRTKTIKLSEREYDIDRVDGVPQKTVTPDPEQVKRARKEAEKVWLARQEASKNKHFLTPVAKPAEAAY